VPNVTKCVTVLLLCGDPERRGNVPNRISGFATRRRSKSRTCRATGDLREGGRRRSSRAVRPFEPAIGPSLKETADYADDADWNSRHADFAVTKTPGFQDSRISGIAARRSDRRRPLRGRPAWRLRRRRSRLGGEMTGHTRLSASQSQESENPWNPGVCLLQEALTESA